MVYYNPHITGQYSIPKKYPRQPGFLLHVLCFLVPSSNPKQPSEQTNKLWMRPPPAAMLLGLQIAEVQALMSSSVFTSNISIWLQMASRKSFCKHLPAATGGGVWLPCATIGSPLLRFPTSLHEGIVRYVACMCPFIVDVQNLPFGSGTSMQLRITAYRFAV